MSRLAGDKNLSLREQKKDAELAVLKAKLAAEKAAKKVLEVKIKELRAKIV
jgi:hypothetical protein